MHHLNTAEGTALAQVALALRPDWASNNPAKVFYDANPFEHATDYLHCIRALMAYATSTAPRMRTPDLYTRDGPWWRNTHPKDLAERTPTDEATGTRRARQTLDLARRLEEQEQASETIRSRQALGQSGTHRQQDR